MKIKKEDKDSGSEEDHGDKSEDEDAKDQEDEGDDDDEDEDEQDVEDEWRRFQELHITEILVDPETYGKPKFARPVSACVLPISHSIRIEDVNSYRLMLHHQTSQVVSKLARPFDDDRSAAIGTIQVSIMRCYSLGDEMSKVDMKQDSRHLGPINQQDEKSMVTE